jgi:hypothetical protein
MKKLVAVVAFVTVGAGAAFGYTFPDVWLYDGLITYDHGGLPLVPRALHFNVGAGYLTASKFYDEDGDVEDANASVNVVAVPIDIGYAFNERILADVTFQILRTSIEWDDGESDSVAGLGDVWIKGRYIAPVDAVDLGGRLGVKIPVGKVDYDDDKLELGDDQWDIDAALVAGMYPERGFAMNGQLGFRYRMERTVSIEFGPGEEEEWKEKPGTLIYLHVEPGYSMGTEKAFQIYVPIGYEMTTAEKDDGETVDDSETNGLYVGLAPKYTLDANNTLGIKFLYPLMGKNVLKSMLIGITYEGYVPL